MRVDKIKYLYNPIENGAPIANFVFNFKKYNHDVGKILQYEDEEAQAILGTYEFLQDLSRSDVEKKLEELKKPFPCTYCDKSFPAAIALSGHMRSHQDEVKDKEEPLDSNLVPVAEGAPTNIFQGPNVAQMQRKANPDQQEQLKDDETENSAFYGPGFQETHGK